MIFTLIWTGNIVAYYAGSYSRNSGGLLKPRMASFTLAAGPAAEVSPSIFAIAQMVGMPHSASPAAKVRSMPIRYRFVLASREGGNGAQADLVGIGYFLEESSLVISLRFACFFISSIS